MVGERLGSYRVLRKLGEGGMGVVYVGEHAELGHPVAIKLLLPELSQNPEVVQRFFNEARAATRVRNPGIVQVHDFGHHPSGSAYFVMELLDGQSLAARLREHAIAPAQAVALIRQAANTLAAAHAQGIVHRDLKPDNIYLTPDAEVPGGERAKILDFGIAKLADESQGISMKTRTGTVMGTPYYMSPEQCRGAGGVDHRSDIYSLGCILYEMVCGRPPFLGAGAGEVLGMHQFVAAAPAGSLNATLPPGLDTLIMRMLAKSPDQRPQSMTELARALEPFLPAGAGPSGQMMAHLASLPPPAPVPVSPRTTLGSAVGQATARGGGGAGKWVALGGLAVAGLAVGLWQAGVFGHQRSDAAVTTGAAMTTPTPAAPTAAPTPPIATPPPIATAPAAPVVPDPIPVPTPTPAPVAGVTSGATGQYRIGPPSGAPGQAPAGPTDYDTGLAAAAVKRHMSSIKYCYEAALLKNPALAGKVTATFSIGASGRVAAAAVGGVDDAVDGCIAGVIRGIEFPKPSGSEPVTISFPFVFQSDGSAGPAPRAPAAKAGKAAKKSDPLGQAPPARSHDEVECLLDPTQPGCKKVDRIGAHQPSNLPERLDQSDIMTGMGAVQARAEACYQQFKVPGAAKVNLRIAPSGSVTSATTEGSFAGTPTGACLEKAVRAAHFRSFSGGPMSVRYPFILG